MYISPSLSLSVTVCLCLCLSLSLYLSLSLLIFIEIQGTLLSFLHIILRNNFSHFFVVQTYSLLSFIVIPPVFVLHFLLCYTFLPFGFPRKGLFTCGLSLSARKQCGLNFLTRQIYRQSPIFFITN